MALSGAGPAVMGIVNVTPDSFFAAARTEAHDAAVRRGIDLFDLGCDIVDVGGESTRPGAATVDAEEEMRRVLDVVEALSAHGPVSIDTRKETVARAAVARGACVINDVGATLVEVAGELAVGYVAMHAQGTPDTMQVDPHYDDVLGEVEGFLEGLATRARAAGVSPLWLDPGIGFGKTTEHNLTLLAHVAEIAELARRYGAGVLIGTSRKRFLGALGPEPLDVDERLEGSLATEAWSLLGGAAMIRVHDARAALWLRDLLARPLEEVGA